MIKFLLLFYLNLNFSKRRNKKHANDYIEESNEEGTLGFNSMSHTPQASDSEYQSEMNELYPKKILYNDSPILAKSEVAQNKINEFDKQTFELNKKLGTSGEITSLSNKEKWNGLFSHFFNNLDKYLINGNLIIVLNIRYSMCVYIIAFIPADFIFFIPASYKKLLPKKAYEIPIFSDGLKEFNKFLQFVKEKSEKEFIITFVLGRQGTAIDDLKMLATLPAKIFSDPMTVLREILAFSIRSEGYEDFKKNYKK
ncbi:hypothetical protein CWI36_0758p0020 [Hamiltosporidium magnivora]|uniref:Uncharacterized protein n=1 Tax=Hamiltosporidium magnivora TaxID=148818 RepID=A0A4Q9L9Q8_9MICR|nr:hypothetical protein CWI36_0758p0020 [Hamiltosporidium magnivora]